MKDPKHIAFQEAYQACHEPFLKYCSALAYGKMDVQDLVQDVLLSTYQHFDNIANKEQLLHYLIKAARNRFISISRKAQRQTPLEAKHTARLESRGVKPDMILDIQLMYRMLNRLPQQQKEALILFEISGFSIKEIAVLQDKRVGAIKTTLSRGRKKLQYLLSEKETIQKRPLWIFLLFTNSSKHFNMNNESNTLFDTIKNVPTELSLSEINQLIYSLPTNNSSLNEIGQKSIFSNLNSLIMTSSIISFLTVLSVFLFVSTTTPSKVAIAQTISTTSLAIEEVVHPTELSEPQISSTATLLPAHKKQNPLAILPNKKDEIQTPKRTLLSNIELPKLTPQATQNPKQALSDCDTKPSFNINLEKFKKELLSSLKTDGLIASKSESVRFSFLEKNVFLNGDLLKGENQINYRNYLGEIGVKPCPRRIVDVTPKYVAIGDLTDEGFVGESFGNIESMDLDKYVLKNNFSENTKQRIDKYLTTSEKEIRKVKPFSAISIEGNVKVVYQMGISDKVTLETNGIPSDDIIIENDKKTLRISVKGDHANKRAVVHLRATKLAALALVKGAQFSGTDYIESRALAISMQDDAVADLKVKVDTFVANINAATLNVNGKCKTYVSNSQNNAEEQGIFDADLEYESAVKR